MAIDVRDKSVGQGFNGNAFNGCLIAAIEAASRWQSLLIYSLPRPPKSKVYPIVPPLKNLEMLSWKEDCDLGSFFEPLMSAITTTATPHLTNITLRNLKPVLYLVQRDCLHVFRSLTMLVIWLSKRMESTADILPHLQRLEEFHARNIDLPIYPPDTPLPFIQTLYHLRLRSVSVQWMAGNIFPVLNWCSIASPHRTNTIRVQPVIMPACTDLTYDSNDLDPLRYFRDLPLDELRVTSGQWSVTRGNRQLIALCHMVVACAQNLTGLDLEVRCSERLLTDMLRLLPALQSLTLRLASPRALSETFFHAFVATNSNADGPCEMGTRPSLSLLGVVYKRWLRGPERMALLPVFGDIVSSRLSENNFRLGVNFEGLAHDWLVLRHVESIHEVADDETFVIGFSTPHGIIPLVSSADDPLTEVPFKEAEYLVAGDHLSVGCLLTLHHLVELRVRDENCILLPSVPPPNLPLFHTLRVLEAGRVHHSFLAGHTFHRLERCRMSLYGERPNLGPAKVTQMPVCRSLDVDDLTLLATLKLPQLCELSVSLDHPEFNTIWETHVAVNANLSGLRLLHAYEWYQQADLIRVLKCLPVLTSLILGNGSDLDADFFGGFLPMHPNETSALTQSHDEGQRSAFLCPMLSSLLIEKYDPMEQLELIPLFKEIVALRAVGGCPLKKFTLFNDEFEKRFELIGSYGTFVVKKEFLDEGSEPFKLDI